MTTTDKRAAADELFDALVERLVREPGVTHAKVFGLPCLKTDGKVFIAFWRDTLVVKLPVQRVEQAVASGEAAPFASDAGRVMKGWASFHPSTAEGWLALATEARAYVIATA